MKKTQKPNDIKAILDLVRKEIAKDIINIPEIDGDVFDEHVEVFSTGNLLIDDALGIGGIPRGRITEIMGMEGGGKTTLVLHTIKTAQEKGFRCAFIDTEHALDRERMLKIGVDYSKLAISQPDSAEQALDLLDLLVRSKAFGIIVVDSVAALIPRAEIEGEMSDANIGLQARLMGKILRKIVGPAHKTNTTVIFTNQLRAKLGGFSFVPQEIGSGGNALKFYASIRIDIRRIKNNKSGDKLVSTDHKIVVKKNKLAIPMGTCIVKIGENGWQEESN